MRLRKSRCAFLFSANFRKCINRVRIVIFCVFEKNFFKNTENRDFLFFRKNRNHPRFSTIFMRFRKNFLKKIFS